MHREEGPNELALVTARLFDASVLQGSKPLGLSHDRFIDTVADLSRVAEARPSRCESEAPATQCVCKSLAPKQVGYAARAVLW